MSEQSQPDHEQPETFTVDLSELQNQPTMRLDDAVHWIMSRGRPVNLKDYDELWEAAARDLFSHLHQCEVRDRDVPVKGYRVPSEGRKLEPLPSGIWDMMTTASGAGASFDPHLDAFFDPVSQCAKPEYRGVICIGEERFEDVQVSTEFLVTHWLPNTESSRPKKVDPRVHWDEAVDWLKERIAESLLCREPKLSRGAVEKVLHEKFGMSTTTARKIWHDTVPDDWKRAGRPSRSDMEIRRNSST